MRWNVRVDDEILQDELRVPLPTTGGGEAVIIFNRTKWRMAFATRSVEADIMEAERVAIVKTRILLGRSRLDEDKDDPEFDAKLALERERAAKEFRFSEENRKGLEEDLAAAVVGWQGIQTEDGVDVTFSPVQVEAFLAAPGMLETVMGASLDAYRVATESKDDLEGKSEGSSDGG